MKKYITKHSETTQVIKSLIDQITRTGVPVNARIIYKGRNTVYTVPIGEHEMNIKAFHCPNFLNAYIYTTLRKGKAIRSFLNATRLLEMGFLSPLPLGYGEERDGLKMIHSYYFSEQLQAQNMRDWTLKPDCEPLLRAFAREIAKLHKAGVWHKDFSPGNILYTGNEANGYKFYYIDLNRMKFDVHDHNTLMTMFRAINLDPAETERLARYYALEAGLDPDLTAREALSQLNRYLTRQKRKKWLKRFFKRKKK